MPLQLFLRSPRFWCRFGRVVCAAGLGLLVSFFAGCVRREAEDPRRLVFAVWGSVQQLRGEQEIVDEFQRQNPGYQVELLHVPLSRYQEKLQAMMVAQAAPDVLMVSMQFAREWAARGVLTDLSAEMSRLAADHPLLPVPEQVSRYRGRTYSLPVSVHGLVTYVNLDALARAQLTLPETPLTWEQILEFAPRLAARRGDPAALTDYALVLPPLINFLLQHGVALFDDLEDPRAVTVNTPAAVTALDLYRRILESGYAVPPEVTNDAGTYQLFRDGRVALYFQGKWFTPEFARRARFRWDVRPLPAGPQGNVSQHGFTALAVWAGSPRQEAARKFAAFYASPEGARLALQYQRTVPVYREIAQSPVFLQQRPPESVHFFVETMEEGRGGGYLYAPGMAAVARLVEDCIPFAHTHPEVSSAEIIASLAADLERWLAHKRATGVL